MFNREACVDRRLGNREVTFFETLEGLEARIDGQDIAVLRDYRSYTHMSWVEQRSLPRVLNFEPRAAPESPRIAVANRH